MRTLPAAVLIAVGLTLGLAGRGYAYSMYRDAWLAAYPDACQDLVAAANSCATCHVNGFSLNSYGQDFQTHGFSVTAIEGLDSDGDGVTNIQEIQDCTLMWDASSLVAAEKTTWSALKGRYR